MLIKPPPPVVAWLLALFQSRSAEAKVAPLGRPMSQYSATYDSTARVANPTPMAAVDPPNAAPTATVPPSSTRYVTASTEALTAGG